MLGNYEQPARRFLEISRNLEKHEQHNRNAYNSYQTLYNSRSYIKTNA